jgi:CHAT domain-containing protein
MAIEMHTQLAFQIQSDYLAQQHSERAWEYIERAKSRAFLDSLGTSSFRLPNEIPTDVHKQETKLLESLESFNGLRSTQTTDRQHVIWDEYQTIRSQLDQLWQEMAQISPQAQDYVNLRQGQPISFQALKQLMTSRAAKPLETNLITTDNLTLLFLMREDFSEPIIKEIPRSAAEIRAFVAQHFSEELGANGSNGRSTSDKVRNLVEDDYQTFLQDFVSPLIEPAPQGGPIARIGDIIWFVPHDFLHYLPLHAVKLNGQYLIDRNPVCYTPSASVMKYCHQKRKGQRETALILGDPLIYTTDQTLSIQALFQPGHAELHIEDATKDLLTNKLKAAKAEIDILHIACHGKFNRDQARQSGIQLQDGKLTAEEIFGLELNADLVTLSACESGINENQPGDELIGLTRALIYAGTPSVIVSLWEVDAISTSILMTKFYQKLLSGATKVDALQQAQLELRNMTAQEAIDTYYTTAIQRFTEPSDRQQLQWDMANLCYNVGDFEKAASLYQNLHETIAPNSSEIARLDNLILQCELGGQNTSQLRPYAHPYFWAPFVLVGDWR